MTTPRAEGLFARFAVESGKLSASIVKPKLFEPDKFLKVSVFDVGGLMCPAICDLGIDVAQKRKKQKLYGWGEIFQEAVASVNLRIEPDEPPPRHANIVGWPEDPSERKLKQQLLAQNARAIKFDPPIQVELPN